MTYKTPCTTETSKPISPTKAIRAKCLDCCCGSSAEVKCCPCEDCALHPFRFGKNPYRAKREFTADEKKALAKRLRTARNQA